MRPLSTAAMDGVLRTTTFSVVAGLLMAGCGAATTSAGGSRLTVVAAENPWGDIAAQIGGDRVAVTSIITDPSADPHTYETDPQAAAAVSGAAVVIENGAGYDGFIDRLLSTNPQPTRDVVTIAQVAGLTGDNPNPHLWYDPASVDAAAHAIESHLASHDPSHSSAFAANLQRFLTAYQPYVDTLAMIRAKHGGAAIGYTERVAGYLVAAAHLQVTAPATFAQAIEDGNDPSPADTASMETAMSHRVVRVLLYNAQVTSPATQAVKDLAGANHIPVVGVAETVPSGQPSFQAWQIGQAKAILAALGG